MADNRERRQRAERKLRRAEEDASAHHKSVIAARRNRARSVHHSSNQHLPQRPPQPHIPQHTSVSQSTHDFLAAEKHCEVDEENSEETLKTHLRDSNVDIVWNDFLLQHPELQVQPLEVRVLPSQVKSIAAYSKGTRGQGRYAGSGGSDDDDGDGHSSVLAKATLNDSPTALEELCLQQSIERLSRKLEARKALGAERARRGVPLATLPTNCL